MDLKLSEIAKTEGAKAALDDIEKEHANSADVEVTTTGVEASINTTRKGWMITAYVKRLWSGKTEEGAKISKKF